MPFPLLFTTIWGARKNSWCEVAIANLTSNYLPFIPWILWDVKGFSLPPKNLHRLQWVRVSSGRLTSKLFYQRATIQEPVSTIKVLFNPGLLFRPSKSTNHNRDGASGSSTLRSGWYFLAKRRYLGDLEDEGSWCGVSGGVDGFRSDFSAMGFPITCIF